MINIDSTCGRIGPFWWVNSCCSSFELIGLYGLIHDPSRHLAWREGGCGLDLSDGFRLCLRRPRFHLIRSLN
jgi:hypothetical protein